MAEDCREAREGLSPVEKEHDAVVKEAEREAAERESDELLREAGFELICLADVEPTPKRSKPYMDDTPEPEGEVMSDRLTRIGEMAHGTVRQEDVGWMIDEIERLRALIERRAAKLDEMERPDLKRMLMELGNRLVTDHGWEPVAGAGARTCGQTRDHTGLIAGLTQQINDNREMRELLNEFGFDWPVVEEDER